jgi:hypothetical protein
VPLRAQPPQGCAPANFATSARRQLQLRRICAFPCPAGARPPRGSLWHHGLTHIWTFPPRAVRRLTDPPIARDPETGRLGRICQSPGDHLWNRNGERCSKSIRTVDGQSAPWRRLNAALETNGIKEFQPPRRTARASPPAAEVQQREDDQRREYLRELQFSIAAQKRRRGEPRWRPEGQYG